MNTKNMPTTNQAQNAPTIAEKIPPTLAAGAKKTASTAVHAGVGVVKGTVNAGMRSIS